MSISDEDIENLLKVLYTDVIDGRIYSSSMRRRAREVVLHWKQQLDKRESNAATANGESTAPSGMSYLP